MRKVNLTGRTFGRLTVLRKTGKNTHGNSTWLCRCVCGTEKELLYQHLTTGGVRSCGCLRTDSKTKKGDNWL